MAHYSDSFETESDPAPNFTTQYSSQDIEAVGGQAEPTQNGTEHTSRYSTATDGDDQYSQAKTLFSGTGASVRSGVAVRCDNGASDGSCYYFEVRNVTPIYAYFMHRSDDGSTLTTIGAGIDVGTGGYSAGDLLRVTISGTYPNEDLDGEQNVSGGGWTAVGSRTGGYGNEDDQNYVGIAIYRANAATHGLLDDWAGGDGTEPDAGGGTFDLDRGIGRGIQRGVMRGV